MRSPFVPFLLGVAVIAGAIYVNASQRRTHDADVRDITALRAELDSARAALSRAPTAADSAGLSISVQSREYILGRREFHVPMRAEAIAEWWGITGPGTLLAGVGGLLVAFAVWYRRRAQHEA